MQNTWPALDNTKKRWIPNEIKYSTKDLDFDSDSESETEHSASVRPDWRKWKSMRYVSIDCAVLLALNLNPEVFESFSRSNAPEIVKTLHEVSLSLQHLFKGQHGYRTVDLVEYGLYARSNMKHLLLNGTLPNDFPRVVLKAAPPSLQSEVTVSVKDDSGDTNCLIRLPYMTSKLNALFKIMGAVHNKELGRPTKAIVTDMTNLPDHDSRIIASLIEPYPDGRARRPWPSETDDFPRVP